MMNLRLRKAIVTSVLAIAMLALGSADALATHFRYGSISWSVPNPSTAPRTVQIRFDAAWRWSFAWYRVTLPDTFIPFANPPLGSLVTGSATDSSIAGPNGEYALRIMQGTTVVATIPLYMTVTGVDAGADIMTTTFTATYTLPVQGSYRIEFNECCRLSNLVGPNADQKSIVTAGMTVSNSGPVNQQPVAATLPIMNVLFNQSAATFTIPAYDPDGDPLLFTLPTVSESGLVQSAPTGFFINPTTGVVTWNTTTATGTVLNGLYALQVKVADNKGAYTVVDLLLRPVAAVGQPPVVRINGQPQNAVFNVVRNTPMSFSVLGTDPEGAPVTLTSSPRPAGSVMTPSLPTTASGNVSSTFTWTPPPSAVGTYVITYSAIDGNGLQGTRSATINVTNNPPTVFCTPSGGAIEASSPSGALFSVSAEVNDADGDLLSRTVLIDGAIWGSQTGIIPGNVVPFTTPLPIALGNHTYEVRVSDSLGAPVSCSGSFSIVDTTPPSLMLPSDITVPATFFNGADVTFSVSATDIVAAFPAVSCTPPSGSRFPFGTTAVQCTATDYSSNSTSASFNVTVTKVATSLTPIAITPNTLVGSLIEITSFLNRTTPPVDALVGEHVRWVVNGPGPTDTITQGSIVNSAGFAYLPFTPTARGVYSVTAYFDGGGAFEPTQSETATFTVYQRTQLFVYPSNGVVGETIVELAELRTVPQGTPIPGKLVNFSFSGPSPVPPADMVTDGSGQAIITSSFALPGDYSITAAFADAADLMTDAAGTIPPVQTVATAPITIQPVVSTLSNLFAESDFGYLVGTDVRVRAHLSISRTTAGPVEGRPVTFTLTSPSGVTTLTSMTTPDGLANVVFPLVERGVHTIAASYEGNLTTTGSSIANFPPLVVYQRTRLTVNPATGVAGGNVAFTGTLTLVPQNAPLDGKSVSFSSNGFAGFANGITDSAGNVIANGAYELPGSYLLTGIFDGTVDYYTNEAGTYPAAATTASSSATISAAGTAVSMTAPATGLVASPFTVSATLTRTDAPAGPIENAMVVFQVFAPGSASYEEVVGFTDASGHLTGSFTPTERGAYTVIAQFGGFGPVSASSSAPSTISVYQRTQLSLAAATGGTNALPVVATLTALPQNIPLSNQLVQFSFDGVVAPQSALTNAGGAATVLVSIPSVGTYASHAMVFNAADFLTDAAGSLPPAPSTVSSTITITDATAPVIVPIVTGTLGSNGSYTSDVTVSWSVTDPETGITSSTGCAPTTITTDGTFSLTCTATSGGGTSSASVSITRDATAPTISSATPSQSSLWPPDHRMMPITIAVSAADTVAPSCSITSITSNEPQNGLGDGDTPNDWLITGPLTAQVRAERAGNGNGRVYTFTVRCVDGAGNAATSTTTVSVPKSQKK